MTTKPRAKPAAKPKPKKADPTAVPADGKANDVVRLAFNDLAVKVRAAIQGDQAATNPEALTDWAGVVARLQHIGSQIDEKPDTVAPQDVAEAHSQFGEVLAKRRQEAAQEGAVVDLELVSGQVSEGGDAK